MTGYSTHVVFFLLFFGFYNIILGQVKLNPNGYNIFYNENETKASEGILKNGKPDGFWKTYYFNGVRFTLPYKTLMKYGELIPDAVLKSSRSILLDS